MTNWVVTLLTTLSPAGCAYLGGDRVFGATLTPFYLERLAAVKVGHSDTDHKTHCVTATHNLRVEAVKFRRAPRLDTRGSVLVRSLPVPDDDLLPVLPDRPRTRGDCAGGSRPCPWVGCRYHLAIEVHLRTGKVRARPEAEDDLSCLPETCSLDVADRGPNKLDTVALAMGVTRERARQIEERALGKLRTGAPGLREHLDASSATCPSTSFGERAPGSCASAVCPPPVEPDAASCPAASAASASRIGPGLARGTMYSWLRRWTLHNAEPAFPAASLP